MRKNDIHHDGLSKTIWIHILAVLLCTSISQTSFAKEQFFVAVGLAKPPYVIQANNTGFEIELIRNVLAKMGKSAKFIYTSFGHTPKMLTVDEIDAVITTSNKIFKDPTKLSNEYITYENVAISLKKSKLNINSITDLSNYSIASFQKADKVLGKAFAAAINNNHLFIQVADQERQPLLLLKERIDVIVMDKNIFNYLIYELKLGNPEEQFTFHYIFPKNNYRVAFKDSKNTRLFNDVFSEYSNSEDYQRLLKLYQLDPLELKK